MKTLLVCQWDGDSFVPLPRLLAHCTEEYVVGQFYRLDIVTERSQRSHSHYFAALHDAWLNLPDEKALDFPTDQHLRKHALILTGYRNERKLVASSPEEARKIAAFIKPRDEYAIVSVAGNIVIEWTAQSQSRKAMGGPTFQKSKDDVLEFVADLIGVSADTLSANAARAA